MNTHAPTKSKFVNSDKPQITSKPNEFSHIIVIAIGDDYRFAFFGLVTKLWLKFQGLFY